MLVIKVFLTKNNFSSEFIFMFTWRLIGRYYEKTFVKSESLEKRQKWWVVKKEGGAIEGRSGSNLLHTIGEIVR